MAGLSFHFRMKFCCISLSGVRIRKHNVFIQKALTLASVFSADRETVLEYVNQGNLNRYAEEAFIDELIHWLRFNRRETFASLDGLYTRCSGIHEVPRWLGQIFVAGTKPEQQADADAKKLRSSPGAVVVSSEVDDKTAWVRTGQVYQRLALTMTSLNIKSAFLNLS